MERKTTILVIATALLLVLPTFFSFISFSQAVQPSAHSQNVVAVFNSNTLPSNFADVISAAGGQVIKAIPEIGVVDAKANPGVFGDTFLANLNRNPAINAAGYDIMAELIAPTSVVADDPAAVTPDTCTPMCPPPPASIVGAPARDRYYIPAAGNVPSNEWGVMRVGGFGGGIYGLTGGAWDRTTGSSSITIAIIDTGISPLHPDVGGKVIDAQSSLFGTTSLFGASNDDGTPDDQVGHGTWTASLAAGRLDSAGGLGGVVGVAPGVNLANLKTLVRTPTGGGTGEFAWTTAAIVYAAEQGYQVISMSLGGFADLSNRGDRAVYTSILRATNFAFNHGSILIAAAGNAALNLDTIGQFVELPGQLPNVISVTATGNPFYNGGVDFLASYSDFGTSLHGLAAPGGDSPAGGAIGSTGFIRGACSPGKPGVANAKCFTLGNVYYVRATGTSASTPLVAGAAALVFSVNPTLRPDQVRAILYQTAQDIGKPGYDAFFNFGLVDATAAVMATPSP